MKKVDSELEIIHFKSEGMLYKHIGRNQIDSETVALTEIVKNSYDADATEVNIFFNKPDSDNGEIIVTDNGHGMTKEEFINYWMKPGTAHKEIESRSPKWRRVMLGRKGMGRFGTDKISEVVVIKSKTAKDSFSFSAKIDAGKFEEPGATFQEVPIELRNINKSDQKFVLLDYPDGTEIRMKHLRKKWTEAMIKEVKNELAKMISPDKQNSKFNICIDVNNKPELNEKLENNLSNEFTHELLVKIDKLDSFTITMNNRVVKTGNIIEETKRALNTNDFPYTDFLEDLTFIKSFGPMNAKILYFSKGGLVFRGSGRHGKRADHSGIKIYRSGFRVLPYGEKGDDWLKIKTKRSSRGGKYFIISDKITGFINIDSDTNPKLEDTTNRQGLIDNDEKRTFELFFSEVVIEELNSLIEQEQNIQKEEDRKKRYQNVSRQVSEILNLLSSDSIKKAVADNNKKKAAEARKTVVDSKIDPNGKPGNRKTHEKRDAPDKTKKTENVSGKINQKNKRILTPTNRLIIRPIDAWIEGTRWVVRPDHSPDNELESWINDEEQEIIYNTGHAMFIAAEFSDKALGKNIDTGSGVAVQIQIHKSIALAWADYHENREKGTFWERYNEYIFPAATLIKKNSKFAEEVPEEQLEEMMPEEN